MDEKKIEIFQIVEQFFFSPRVQTAVCSLGWRPFELPSCGVQTIYRPGPVCRRHALMLPNVKKD